MSNTPSPQLIDSGPERLAAGLIHRVAQPQTPGPYPTAVLIHGRAGTEDVMWVFRRAIPHNWLVVSPRAIYPDPNDGGYSWTREESRGAGERGSGGEEETERLGDSETARVQSPNLPVSQSLSLPTMPMFDEGVAALERFIRSLPALYNADLDRVVLMGFSQGAAVSFALAQKHPNLIKAIASLVGFMPQSPNLSVPQSPNLQAPISDLPVFMAVGKEDPTIPPEAAREAADILRAAGADLSYHEYDTGHKLNAQGTRDLTAWWSKLG